MTQGETHQPKPGGFASFLGIFGAKWQISAAKEGWSLMRFESWGHPLFLQVIHIGVSSVLCSTYLAVAAFLLLPPTPLKFLHSTSADPLLCCPCSHFLSPHPLQHKIWFEMEGRICSDQRAAEGEVKVHQVVLMQAGLLWLQWEEIHFFPSCFCHCFAMQVCAMLPFFHPQNQVNSASHLCKTCWSHQRKAQCKR